MKFEKDFKVQKLGEITGYILAYLVFTTILFIILTLIDKLGSWNYLHIAVLTLIITITGLILNWLLK